MKRLLLLALAAALRAGGAEPSTTRHANGWGVDDKTLAFGGGVTVTEAPPALREALRVTVPDELLGRPVTALAPRLFADWRNLEGAILPPSLEEIGEEAFRGCRSLAWVVTLPPDGAAAPARMLRVGARAFADCTALRRLEFPSAALRVGPDALAGCQAVVVAGKKELSDADGAEAPAALSVETSSGVRWTWREAPEGDGALVVRAAMPWDESAFGPEWRGAPLSFPPVEPAPRPRPAADRGALDLAVPHRLGGRPVVALGPGALAELPAMRLVVPASVRRIGAGAIPPATAERLVFLGPPPAFDAADPAAAPAGDPDDDPLDWLEYPAAFAREWERALAPALPSAEPEGARPPPGIATGEETADGVRWTYSVRDGRAFAGAGPGRPALAPGDAAGDVSLPARLGGLPVLGLARGAFRGCDRLRSLRIDGARDGFEIGDQAFLGCAALTNLARGAECTLADIGAEAFRGCVALERFDATGARRLGPAAFAGCTSLRELRLGPGPDGGGADAVPPLFAAGCRSLGELELPVGVVGRGAFRGCTSLRAVRFSPRLRVLGGNAFAGCAALRRADIPPGCLRIGPDVFDRTPLDAAPHPAASGFLVPAPELSR